MGQSNSFDENLPVFPIGRQIHFSLRAQSDLAVPSRDAILNSKSIRFVRFARLQRFLKDDNRTLNLSRVMQRIGPLNLHYW